MQILGKAYTTTADFAAYLASLKFTNWKPSCIVIHHCSEPSLLQRPIGFQAKHMDNLRDFYEGKGWHAGPHLFVDDNAVWTFSPMTAPGVHAVSFNATGLGIEMLGDYDVEDPWTGRGLDVLTNTAKATKLLMQRLSLGDTCIRFHRDDPKTSKSCPGDRVQKDQFLALVKTAKV